MDFQNWSDRSLFAGAIRDRSFPRTDSNLSRQPGGNFRRRRTAVHITGSAVGCLSVAAGGVCEGWVAGLSHTAPVVMEISTRGTERRDWLSATGCAKSNLRPVIPQASRRLINEGCGTDLQPGNAGAVQFSVSSRQGSSPIFSYCSSRMRSCLSRCLRCLRCIRSRNR